MSKPAATAVAEPAAANIAPAPRSLLSKLKVVGLILGVVVIEWAVAYMYLPSAPSPAAASSGTEHQPAEAEGHEDSHEDPHADSEHGGGHAEEPEPSHDEHDAGHGAKEESGHGHGHGDGHAKPTRVAGHGGQEEVDLGEFTITAYQPASSTTAFISFHLYGTVNAKHSNEFLSRLEGNKHRVRDNVIVIIRSAEIADLTDAGLGLIKRRILETTNKTLGKPLLQAVVFSEFSFVEQ